MLNNTTRLAVIAALSLAGHSFALAQAPAKRPAAPAPTVAPAAALKTCTSVSVDRPTQVTLGKSTVVQLGYPVVRMVVGGRGASRAAQPAETTDKDGKPVARTQTSDLSDGVADVDITLLSSTELYILGKRSGSMNLVLQGTDGRCLIKDIIVTLDPDTLQASLADLMPGEKDVRVRAAENAIVLTGTVSDALTLSEVVNLATSYGDGKKVVNLLRTASPQQVMLEVKIAEVSKTLLDTFGLDYSRLYTSGAGATSRVISGIVGGGAAVLGHFGNNLTPGAIAGQAAASVTGSSAAAAGSLSQASTNASLLGIDAQKRDGLVRVLAEPNLMAISGQQASFLSGGKIFIPVAQSNTAGGTTITLEEKEFGVGLQFMPTVLNGSRINLKLTTEVSELSQTGSPFTTLNGVTSVLPSMATRRADTTVQLSDGQSFVIAGLIRNNVTETINRFPGAGEIPVLGALFRSTEFQNDQTELVFVVTPRLVKPLSAPPTLPTDNHIIPSRSDVIFMGKAEGKAKEAPAPVELQSK